MSLPAEFQILPHSRPSFKYTTITEYFQQDDPNTDASTFDYATQNLGLINRGYPSPTQSPSTNTPQTQWHLLAAHLSHLNATTSKNTTYKLLFLARHGQGVHNVAEAQYGTPEWDAHWSKLPGNDTMNWVDAPLTSLGITQAKNAAEVWAKMIPEGIPLPQSYYVSPLDRCLATARYSFSRLALLEGRVYRPVVKEMAREVLGVHTCDQRSSRKVIAERYPEADFEEGFNEDDELWDSEHRETNEEIDERIKGLLDDVFGSDGEEVVSFTTHSGAIASFLRVLEHRPFRLITGGILPVLVKAERQT